MRGLRELRRDNRASSAIEFALVVLPLLLLLFGTIEFGRLLWTRQAMLSLAISTARCMGVLENACANSGTYSATNTTNSAIAGAASLGVALAASNVTLNVGASCGGISNFSSVTIAYTFFTVAPQLISAMSAGIPLSTTACFPNQL